MTLSKVLKWFIYAVALVPLIIFSQYISPFHFGKVIIFRTLIELALVGYLLLIWKDRSYLPKRDAIFWGFLAFVCAFSLATLTSFQRFESFWGTLERMGGLFTFWHYFVYFIILRAVIKTDKEWLNLLRGVILVGVLSAFYGFLQKTNTSWIIGSGDRTRIFGTIGNAALFAGYQLINMFLALTLSFRSLNTKNQRILFLSAAAVNLIAILMTAVRGSILGVGVGLLVFAILYAWTFKTVQAKKILIVVAVLAVGFAIFAETARNTDFVKNSGYLKRITDFSTSSFTVQTRFWAWQAGIEGWKESPRTMLVGWGPEDFNLPFSRHFNPDFYTGTGSETLFDRAHNMFVEVLVTMGAIGFLAYLSLLAAVLWVLRKVFKTGDRHRQITAIGLLSLMAAYMVHNFFIFDTSANFIAIFTVFGFVSWLAGSDIQNEPIVDNLRAIKKPLFYSVAMVMLLAAIILIYKVNIIPAEANYASTRGIVLFTNDQPAAAAVKFREAIAYDTFGKYEIRNQYAQSIFNYLNSGKELTPEIKTEMLFVIGKIKEIAQTRPYDYLPRLYVSRLDIVLGTNDPSSPYNDEALKYSLEALNIAPKFVRTYYEVAQAYLNKGQIDKAVEYFQKAVDLQPNVGVSYWYWGMSLVQAGKTTEGLKIIQTSYDHGYIPDETDLIKLVNVYFKLNDYKGLANTFEKLIKVAPDNPQYHAELAAVYAKLGRIDDAVFQAHEAARVDSSYEPDARAFVQSLGRQW